MGSEGSSLLHEYLKQKRQASGLSGTWFSRICRPFRLAGKKQKMRAYITGNSSYSIRELTSRKLMAKP